MEWEPEVKGKRNKTVQEEPQLNSVLPKAITDLLSLLETFGLLDFLSSLGGIFGRRTANKLDLFFVKVSDLHKIT